MRERRRSRPVEPALGENLPRAAFLRVLRKLLHGVLGVGREVVGVQLNDCEGLIVMFMFSCQEPCFALVCTWQLVARGQLHSGLPRGGGWNVSQVLLKGHDIWQLNPTLGYLTLFLSEGWHVCSPFFHCYRSDLLYQLKSKHVVHSGPHQLYDHLRPVSSSWGFMVLTSSQQLSRSPRVSQSSMINTIAVASCGYTMSLLKKGLHSLRVSGASKAFLLSPVQVTLVRHVGSLSYAWLLLSKTQPPGQPVLKAFPSNRHQAWITSLDLWGPPWSTPWRVRVG